MKIEYYQKYKELKKEKQIFCYSGAMHFNDVILLKELIEKILLVHDVENKQRRKLINILIEALQNTYIHGAGRIDASEKAGQECMLLLGKENQDFFIVLGNLIKKERVRELEEKLQKLIKMEINEIRELYLETLNKGELTEKGGASLGLVRMFIDSAKNSYYKFDEVDEYHAFFSIELTVTHELLKKNAK